MTESEVSRALQARARKLVGRCGAIQGAWRRHRNTNHDSPGDRAPGFLKREVYALATELVLELGSEVSLAELLKAANPLTRIDWSKQYPIWLALLALIDRGGELQSVERKRYAIELDYARAHRVPVELVNGFIWQVGGSKRISRQVAAGAMEPWFDAERHTRKRFISRWKAITKT